VANVSIFTGQAGTVRAFVCEVPEGCTEIPIGVVLLDQGYASEADLVLAACEALEYQMQRNAMLWESLYNLRPVGVYPKAEISLSRGKEAYDWIRDLAKVQEELPEDLIQFCLNYWLTAKTKIRELLGGGGRQDLLRAIVKAYYVQRGVFMPVHKLFNAIDHTWKWNGTKHGLRMLNGWLEGKIPQDVVLIAVQVIVRNVE